MSEDGSRRVAALGALVRRQAAEIGQLKEALHRRTHEHAVACAERDEARREAASLRTELAACRAELDLVRQQHVDTKRQLSELVNALASSDERLRALVRREFVASSERLCADTTYVPEILAAMREQEATVALTPADSSSSAVVATEVPELPGAAASAPGAPSEGRKRRRPANAGGRKPLPEDIERRHTTYVPPADHPALHHALRHDTIGSTTIERWHIGKLDLHIEVITCPVVQLTLKGDITCQQTLSPPAVIERSQVSDALLVQSAIDRVVDHLPAYRQQQRAERLGIHIPRSKLCSWHIALAQFLDGVADAIFDEIVCNPVVGIDDTVHRLLVDDRHLCQKARIWAVTAPAGTFYMYSPTREGRWINELLDGYSGGIMGDASDPGVLPTSGIGRAVRYALKLWSGLNAYVAVGTAEIDNNRTEQRMRRVAMHRKNSLFSASEAGAESYATLLTIAQSALDHKLDPVSYLCDIIEDIHYDRNPLSALTPMAYARRMRLQREKPS